ncbi:MAG: bifunctional 4-hydroxy-2-oxoglutarate aldolase/2-dehydro-3-deoxy-phosphogluconate aldolase [Luteimonas sp.]|nr:bifunctional 4-hydroxy-2-oxoglutarate aldolase/2-dehydro-3-deoxy-phosphogluconate aldolase [Pseudomonadota bacterium]MCW5581238.1 bifunctional 4-hydroxy-2-oxoglutarate aldolase/2-dehydro-3-deoxy-phosphogluconate aldolase [Luteimonas sp.]
MARFSRLDTLGAVIASGLMPLFHHDDASTARRIAGALEEGGARVIEFTNRGEMALKVFSLLSEDFASRKSSLILGAGSVVDAPTAALYIANGANFVVSPFFDAEIARLCNRRMIAYMPGCASATEIALAQEMGVEIVKVFPGETTGGPAFVKAVLGPMPWSRIMPTGGVEATRESIEKWFRAGATCVGMGSNVTRKEWLAAGDFGAMRDTVRAVLGWIEEVRRPSNRPA